MRLDPEKEAAVLDANKDLTKRLRNLSETRLGTTVGGGGDRSAQGAALLTAKYASLLQQGFSEDDANVMVRTLAKASGAMDAYAQSVNNFRMIKADDPASIIKAQMQGVKTFQSIGNIFQQGERGGFAEGIKSVVEQINLLPPEDQYTGLKTLLSQMENLDPTQLKVAQQSIIDMTKQTYGEGSQLFNTQRAIQERTSGSFSALNISTYDDFISKFGGAINKETAASVTAALTSAFETGAITDQQLKDYQLRIEADPNSIDQIEAELDRVTRDRQIKIEATIKLEQQLADDYERINKEIIIKQNDLQAAIEAKNTAIEKEEEAFKQSQKAGQKYIKAKQEEMKAIDEQANKEIDAIEKQTDAYLKAAQKEDAAAKFRSEQTGTMLGGLQSLSKGDVLGFLEAKQTASENARQFSASEEIKAIEEKRDAATEAIDIERDKRVEAIQEEIDKRQEALEKQAEGHEAHMIRLQKERDQMARNASKTIAEMQATSDAIAGIKDNPVIIDWLTNFKNKALAASEQAAIINYLIKHPEATVADALKAVQKDLHQRDQSFGAGVNAAGGERAGGAGYNPSNYVGSSSLLSSSSSGGMTGGASGRAIAPNFADGGSISGPGTGTSDSIPAMLSNGEYVIKASSVKKFGTEAFDKLNGGEPVEFYADGGFVMPTRSGRNRGNYGKKGPLWSLGYHTGLDFAGEIGTDILSVADGSVSSINSSGGSYGKHILVRHNKDLVSLYAHLSKILVGVGDRVSKGQHIGEMGATGNVTGPHLHLEMGSGIYRNATNPLKYLLGSGAVGGEDQDVSVSGSSGERTLEEAIRLVSQAGQGTITELTDLMANGAGAIYTPFNGRQFGGSMTMNKPYLVGENGPEVVMPYGSGSKVDPKFSIPRSSVSPELMEAVSNINVANSSSLVYNINVDAAGVTDPKSLAKYIVSTIKSEENARSFGRSV